MNWRKKLKKSAKVERSCNNWKKNRNKLNKIVKVGEIGKKFDNDETWQTDKQTAHQHNK